MNESQKKSDKFYYYIDPLKCKGCGKCIRNCPASAIDAAYIIDQTKCIHCGICHKFCWFGVISKLKECPSQSTEK